MTNSVNNPLLGTQRAIAPENRKMHQHQKGSKVIPILAVIAIILVFTSIFVSTRDRSQDISVLSVSVNISENESGFRILPITTSQSVESMDHDPVDDRLIDGLGIYMNVYRREGGKRFKMMISHITCVKYDDEGNYTLDVNLKERPIPGENLTVQVKLVDVDKKAGTEEPIIIFPAWNQMDWVVTWNGTQHLT